MPKLLEPLLVDAVKTRFRAFNVTPPGGATGIQALTQGKPTITGVTPKIVASPRPSAPPLEAAFALFQPASKSPADVELQVQATNEVAKYITEISRAIVAAHENWRQRAFLKGVQINGITANGGSVSGPLLSEIVNAAGPSQGLWGNAQAYTRAIGDGLAASWREWELTVRVPSLAWYPTLAAFPGPQAPPVANVPTPMSKLIWSASALSPESLKANMSRRLVKPGPFSEEIFASVADGFSKAVGTWLSTQVVSGVLGRGSVPTFAPPYVPVGPVAGGSAIESGPHFST